MAAPTNAAKCEKSSCQPGAVHTWHISDLPILPANVGYDGVKRKWLGHRQTDSIDPSDFREDLFFFIPPICLVVTRHEL